jgi:signal transduction histidine kinase
VPHIVEKGKIKVSDRQDEVAVLNRKLVETQAALEAEKEARQTFVSLVTHELRVPMTSIKGYTDLLLKGIMGPINDAQTNFLETIRANVERMSKMVSDLSDINKIEGGRLALRFEPVPLGDVVQDALATLQKALAEKDQTLRLEVPEALPPAWADRERFLQVLRSILENASQYSLEGGVITVEAGLDPDDPGHLRVAVRDNGIGIPADEQDQIFTLFFRASDEETRATPGNGLALHLAKRLIKLQSGELAFESERGKGTTFFVSLPIAVSHLAT